MTKPRIWWNSQWLEWNCSLGNLSFVGFGRTPQAAYDHWKILKYLYNEANY